MVKSAEVRDTMPLIQLKTSRVDFSHLVDKSARLSIKYHRTMRTSFSEWYQSRTQDGLSSTHNQCLQKEQDSDDSSEQQVAAVSSSPSRSFMSCPRAKIKIGQCWIDHLIDTGTNLNILSRDTYDKLIPKPLLTPSKIRVFAFNATHQLHLLGAFGSNIFHHGKSILVKYLVLDGQSEKDHFGLLDSHKFGYCHKKYF